MCSAANAAVIGIIAVTVADKAETATGRLELISIAREVITFHDRRHMGCGKVIAINDPRPGFRSCGAGLAGGRLRLCLGHETVMSVLIALHEAGIDKG